MSGSHRSSRAASKSTSTVDDRKPRTRPLIAEGTRLDVWSPEEQHYVRGKLTNKRDDDCWKILYDVSRVSEWILLSKQAFRILHAEGSPEALAQDERISLLERVKVGSRVEIFWKPYSEWFAGTVRKIELGKADEFLIQYDEKDETWENLFAEQFKLLDDITSKSKKSPAVVFKDTQKGVADDGFDDYSDDDSDDALVDDSGVTFVRGDTVDLTKITAGMKISVFFKDETGGKFYDGKVLSDMVARGRTKRFTTIHFDDGETLDVDLAKTDVRFLDVSNSANGSKKRTAKPASNPQSTSAAANAKKLKIETSIGRTSRSTSGKSQSSNNSKKQSSASQSRRSRAAAATKRNTISLADKPKPTFKTRSTQAKHPPPRNKTVNRVPGKETKVNAPPTTTNTPRVASTSTAVSLSTAPPRNSSVRLNRSAPDLVSAPTSVPTAFSAIDEVNPCPVCKQNGMERPRSLECCHTFCRACIMDKCKSSSNHFCPICRFPLGDSDNKIHLYNRETLPEAFRSVVATPDGRGSSRTFSSASAATQALCLDIAARVIINACNAKDPKDRLVGGYSWTFYTPALSLPEPAKFGPDQKSMYGGKVVERICMKTKEVLESYTSASEAARQLNVDKSSVSRVARGAQRSTGGYSFRYKDASESVREGSMRQTPSQSRHFTQNGLPQPVERLSLNTGKVLSSYKSQADAARSLRLKHEDISQVVRGLLPSTGGFFFRHTGSTRLPPAKLTAERTASDDQRNARISTRRSHNRTRIQVQNDDEASSCSSGHDIPIEMLCLETGRVLASFESVTAASLNQNLVRSNIMRVLRGERASTGNFFFRVQGTKKLPPVVKRQRPIPVESLCLQTGTVLAKFESLTDAERELDICKKLIARVARGEVDSAGGYFFRFLGSELLPQRRTDVASGISELPSADSPPENSVDSRLQQKSVTDESRKDDAPGPAGVSDQHQPAHGQSSSTSTQLTSNAAALDSQYRPPAEGERFDNLSPDSSAADQPLSTNIGGSLIDPLHEGMKSQQSLTSIASELEKNSVASDSQLGPTQGVDNPCGHQERDDGERTIPHHSTSIPPQLATNPAVISDSRYGSTESANNPSFDSCGRSPDPSDRARIAPESDEVIDQHPSLNQFPSACDRAMSSTFFDTRPQLHQGDACHYPPEDAADYFRRKGTTTVEQICQETGDTVATFATIKAAAEAVGVSPNSISNCCSPYSKQKFAGGFDWRITSNLLAIPKNKSADCSVDDGDDESANCEDSSKVAAKSDGGVHPLGRAVEQVCLKTGNVLATFCSLRAAADAAGVSQRSIGGCCRPNDKQKTSVGFGWRFAQQTSSPPEASIGSS